MMMNITLTEVRPGAYYDSVVLMQLQRSLAEIEGVLDAGVVMATRANLDLLSSSDFQFKCDAGADDLLIVLKAEDEQQGLAAMAQIDDLLKRRGKTSGSTYRPRSLAEAQKMLPDARWVSISVPGRFVAGVAHEALDLNKHVFIYSDNVSLSDEQLLKKKAQEKGLLVMGPDCGTAIINGIGLGFANRVRRGSIGLIGASGTGLQALTSSIHQRGGGISQAFGTGGRDLKKSINASTTLQCLDLLAQDPETSVIVLVSKPPEANVAAQVLGAAQTVSKPVIVNFIGLPTPVTQMANITFANNLSEGANQAVALAGRYEADSGSNNRLETGLSGTGGFIRALFSGGTLAYESLLSLGTMIAPLYSNIPIIESQRLPDVNRSQGHTILDLGEDEFTQGRLHPMMDNDLRIRRMLREAEDPEVSIILFDVVLGDGAHPNPAQELAAGVEQARKIAEARGASLSFLALLIGTDEDPQNIVGQNETLSAAGVKIFQETSDLIQHSLSLLRPSAGRRRDNLDISILRERFAAINVGLELFHDSLVGQGADSVHVDWRPPAGGNEKLMDLLVKMKSA